MCSYKKCMATPYIQSMEEYYFGRIFDSRYCSSSKRRCPYWQILFSEMADSLFNGVYILVKVSFYI